jgi:hypothetical protein
MMAISMLPAFPKIEKLCHETARQLVDDLAARRAPLLKLIGNHYLHEGSHSAIFRHDESIGESPLHQITGEVEVKPIPIVKFLQIERPRLLIEMAEQFAKGKSKTIYAELDRAIAETGNVIDAKGKPLSEQVILETLQKMDHTFEPDGTWNPPTILASREIIERLHQSESESGADSNEFQVALSKILDKKRDDFRRREADRVLVG